nr:unnamed protein product [Digitaria exilis]
MGTPAISPRQRQVVQGREDADAEGGQRAVELRTSSSGPTMESTTNAGLALSISPAILLVLPSEQLTSSSSRYCGGDELEARGLRSRGAGCAYG